MRGRLLAVVAAIAIYFVDSSLIHAASLVISGSPEDTGVQSNGMIDGLVNATLRVGTGGNDQRGHAAVYFFPLPVVPSPSGIVAADLQLGFTSFAPFSAPAIPTYNVDLYGIGTRSTATTLSADYYDGDPQQSLDTLIQSGYVTPSSAVGIVSTNPSADASLANFLRSLYQPDGTPLGAYAVFRANPSIDIIPLENGLSGYELATADNLDAGGALAPRLSLIVVPEPTGIAFALPAGLLAAAVLRRIRIRSRAL